MFCICIKWQRKYRRLSLSVPFHSFVLMLYEVMVVWLHTFSYLFFWHIYLCYYVFSIRYMFMFFHILYIWHLFFVAMIKGYLIMENGWETRGELYIYFSSFVATILHWCYIFTSWALMLIYFVWLFFFQSLLCNFSPMLQSSYKVDIIVSMFVVYSTLFWLFLWACRHLTYMIFIIWFLVLYVVEH